MKRAALFAVPALCALVLVAGGAASVAPVVNDPLVTFAGSAPTAIVPGADGSFFVLNSGPDSVIQYDAAGHQVGASAALLPAGSKSTAMLSDAYGSLYVANPGSHSISKVDTKTNKVTPFAFPAADVPVALGMSSIRTVYVAKQNNEIASIDSAGTVMLTFAKLPANSDPRAIVTDFGGYSYTANYGNNTISQVSPTGTVVQYADLGAGAGPSALARDHQGRLWVANALGDSVMVFDTSKPAGSAPVATYPVGRGASPRALAVDQFDNVFVADAGTSAISVVVPSRSAPLTVFSGARTAPTGLALTSDNKLLFAEKDSDRVSSVDLETKIGTSTIGPLAVGAAFSGSATATGVGDITFSSPDLPAWLTLDPATGALSGTPTTPGPFSLTLRAQSSIGRSDARTVTFDVAAAPSTPAPTTTPGTTTTPTTGGNGAGGQGTGTGTRSGGHGSSTLASTGAGDPSALGLAGIAAMVLGVTAFVVTGRRRARRRA